MAESELIVVMGDGLNDEVLGERRQEKQLLLYPRACPYCLLVTHQFGPFPSPGDDRNINGKCIFRTATDPTNKSPPSSIKHPYSISQTSITHLLVTAKRQYR